MATLLYSEINILSIVLLGIMAYRASRFGLDTNPKKRAFVSSICFAISFNFFDMVWNLGYTKTIHIPTFLMYVINACYFLSLACMSYCWYLFSEIIHGKRNLPRKAYIILQHLPLVVLFILLVTTPFNGLLFKFDETGAYVRGPLYYFQVGLAFLLTIVASLKNLIYAFSSKHYERKETYATMCAFALPPIICLILQACFQGLPIVSACPTISFLMVYTNSLKLQISLDPLTGILNRRALIQELAHKVRSVKKNKKLYFIFIDIDHFKSLNDRLGHHDGDKALQYTADALRDVCMETGCVCARYGGDEFAVIAELDETKNISDLCRSIETAVKERSGESNIDFPVTVSVGYGEYLKDGDDAQSLIKFADKQMYLKKKKKQSGEK